MMRLQTSPTAWLFLLMCATAARPTGAAEPVAPRPVPAAEAGILQPVPQPDPAYVAPAERITRSGTCECCDPPVRPVHDLWKNRIKPCLQYTHWGYPEYFEEAPLGSALRSNMDQQIVNGMRDQMVLYRFDFEDESEAGAERLNDHGRRRLAELTRWLERGLAPLVVESRPGAPELNEARRRHVVEQLAAGGMPTPDGLVVVGTPTARGLNGEEAAIIRANQLRQTKESGTPAVGSASTSGGTQVIARPTGIPEVR